MRSLMELKQFDEAKIIAKIYILKIILRILYGYFYIELKMNNIKQMTILIFLIV